MLAIQEYAMDLLTKAHQTTLPIDEEAVARWLGAKVHPYSVGRDLLTAAGCWDYAQTVQGLSVCIDGTTCIFYADRLSILERRSVILHECGHIYLKHLTGGSVLGKSGKSQAEAAQEREADAFALFALAPPALLSRLQVTTAVEIERVCRISAQDAHAVAAQMRRTIPRRRPRRRADAARGNTQKGDNSMSKSKQAPPGPPYVSVATATRISGLSADVVKSACQNHAVAHVRLGRSYYPDRGDLMKKLGRW